MADDTRPRHRPMNITLPEDLKEELEKAVPAGERSAFIASAVKEALDAGGHKDHATRMREGLKALKPIGKVEGPGVVEILREIRRGRH